MLDVFVCPSKIGKFTDEGLGEMTAREFYIYGSSKLGGNLRSMYHTSNYSAIQREELMKELNEEADKNAKSIDSVNEEFESKVTLTEAIIK